MIKNFTAQQYDGLNSLPSYASNVRIYTLIATVSNDYVITLAKLTIGESVSAGNPLSHALFESFTDHGKRAKAARTRVSGYDREFTAMKNAMMETGVEFHPTLPNPCETVLCALGEWFKAKNPEIREISLVSQTCH